MFMSVSFQKVKEKGTCIILNILFTLGKCSTAGCTEEGRQSVCTTLLKKMILLCFIVYSDRKLQNLCTPFHLKCHSPSLPRVS